MSYLLGNLLGRLVFLVLLSPLLGLLLLRQTWRLGRWVYQHSNPGQILKKSSLIWRGICP